MTLVTKNFYCQSLGDPKLKVKWCAPFVAREFQPNEWLDGFVSDSDKFRNMSSEQLAEVQHGLSGKSAEDVLIEREWRRRDMIEQHNLDLELLFKQGKWMMASAFIGLLGVILGALLTYVLTTNARKEPQQSLEGTSAQTDQQKILKPKEQSQTKKGE